MKIQYVKGDLFSHLVCLEKPVVIPHICNTIGKFAAGFALVVSTQWPKVKQNYEQWYDKGLLDGKPFQLGEYQSVVVEHNPAVIIINMIAQTGVVGPNNPKPIKYVALARCMDTLGEDIAAMPDAEIHAPKFGSDRAKGNFEFIKELIAECWLARGIPVTIYEL